MSVCVSVEVGMGVGLGCVKGGTGGWTKHVVILDVCGFGWTLIVGLASFSW